jgi:rSAM/selenodomain-associated transferase 1
MRRQAKSCLLVVAKAPVPGLAKTRLCPPATPEQAARIAAAALLDTVDAALAVPDTECVVAMTGTLADAVDALEISAALRHTHVIGQRGAGFGERLAAAHADVAAAFPGRPVLQIGMDTPQVRTDALAAALDGLRGADAVLGPATDGGWWALGLRDPRRAAALRDVPMSRADTGELTRRALADAGLRVAPLPDLSDVDTMRDAELVAAEVPGSRFAEALTGATREGALR